MAHRQIWTLDSGERFHSKDLIALGHKILDFLEGWAVQLRRRDLLGGWMVTRRQVIQQINDHDCGIHVLSLARNLAIEDGDVSKVKPCHMPHFRRLAMLELFLGTLQPLYASH